MALDRETALERVTAFGTDRIIDKSAVQNVGATLNLDMAPNAGRKAKKSLFRAKPPLFLVILGLTLMSFLIAAAFQLWSTSRLADQIIHQEVAGLTRQTHTSLQFFVDNQLQSAEARVRHFASNYQLLEAVEQQNQPQVFHFLDTLYNSETSGDLELLFLLDNSDSVWLDASSPFFSDTKGLNALPLASMQHSEWYLFDLAVGNKSQIVVLRKEPMIDPSTGEVLGSIAGGMVLSGRLSMLNQARSHINIAGLAMVYKGQILAESTIESLDIHDYLNHHYRNNNNSNSLDLNRNSVKSDGGRSRSSKGDDDNLNRYDQYYVGHHPIILEQQLSDLEFVTLISSASFETLSKQYKSQSAIQAFVVLLLALLTTVLIIAVAVRPLIRLITLARHAIDGNEEMAPTTTMIREYSILNSTLSHLIHASNQQKTQLLQLNTQLEHQVDKLEKTNKELDNFAYVASHDLKSPLRGIGLLATWVSQDLGDTLEAETAEHLELMRNRIARMEKLLDDLLTYSKVGRVNSELSEVNTHLLVEDIFGLLGAPSHFQLRCHDDFPTFTTFQVPLEQVLRNLIGNAIKHNNQQNGLIQVSVKEEADRYQFTVADNGPGIPLEHQQRVFGMYQTLRPRDEVEGSGMGLALVKKIVELYGGTVLLQSDGENGTQITFSWPIKNTIEK